MRLVIPRATDRSSYVDGPFLGALFTQALMDGPKTQRQLVESTGAALNTISRWIREFKRLGVVVDVGRAPRPKGIGPGRAQVLWGLRDRKEQQ